MLTPLPASHSILPGAQSVKQLFLGRDSMAFLFSRLLAGAEEGRHLAQGISGSCQLCSGPEASLLLC
jgi:hypothetical protein